MTSLLTIELRDENGMVIRRIYEANRLKQAIADAERPSPCLRFVDPFGDTVFNRLQVPELRAELTALRTGRGGAADEWLDELSALLDECVSSVHTYVWFVGD